MKTTILFLALLSLHFNLKCEEKIERVKIGNAVSPIKLSQKDFFVPKKINSAILFNFTCNSEYAQTGIITSTEQYIKTFLPLLQK